MRFFRVLTMRVVVAGVDPPVVRFRLPRSKLDQLTEGFLLPEAFSSFRRFWPFVVCGTFFSMETGMGRFSPLCDV